MSFYDDTQLEFIGFDPSKKLQTEARLTLDRITWEAPSDSTIKITVVKNKSLYKVNCRIASTIGVFVGSSHSEFSFSALKLLEKDIQRKFRFWKKNRKLIDYKFDNNEPQRVS